MDRGTSPMTCFCLLFAQTCSKKSYVKYLNFYCITSLFGLHVQFEYDRPHWGCITLIIILHTE